MDDRTLFESWAATPPSDGRAASFARFLDRAPSEEARAWAVFLQQRTREWFNLRSAFTTASEIPRILLGERRPSLQTDAMAYGVAQEHKFFEAYRALVDSSATTVGLVVCPLPGRGFFAASPDGLVGDRGCIEIKITADWKNARRGFDERWIVQVQMVMMCARCEWCDLLRCYRPRDNHDELLHGAKSDRSRMQRWRVRASPAAQDAICAAVVAERKTPTLREYTTGVVVEDMGYTLRALSSGRP